jgi:hypothetical protein
MTGRSRAPVHTAPDERVWLCADNAAAWHTSWLTALGLRSERTETVWRALDPPPFIYWAAITLSSAATASEVAGSLGTVCDAGTCLDLSAHGFRVWEPEPGVQTEPWFVRPPGPVPRAPPPPELEIVRVDSEASIAEFESTSLRGFGHRDGELERFSIHPPAVLSDAGATLLVGRVGGVAVAAAMSQRTERSVGIYGVTTIAGARRRGYASALTSELIDPGLPATLSASAEAEGVYRRLGFREVGRLRHWPRASRSTGG